MEKVSKEKKPRNRIYVRNYIGNSCKKCGVIVNEKNWKLCPKKKYISSKCKSCTSNSNHCAYKYDCLELEALSKKRAIYVDKRVIYFKVGIEGRRKYRIKYDGILSDNYIKYLLFTTSLKPSKIDTPQELIQLKREQVKLKREFHSKTNKS